MKDLELEGRVEWVKKVVKDSGTAGVVVGLSGGKDSAVVAAICSLAGVNVLGVNLPIKSSDEDMAYVRKLLTAFPKIEFVQISLNGTFKALVEDLQLDPNAERDKLPLANIKARLRMTSLYALANRYNYLVAGTDNACEAYVGYFTKWGDGAFDFNLLGDLTTEELIELGIQAGVPEECVRRVPTAGLWAGQTDESEMGVSYHDIGLVVRGKAGEVSTKAYAEIMRRHNITEHKRQNPPSYPGIY